MADDNSPYDFAPEDKPPPPKRVAPTKIRPPGAARASAPEPPAAKAPDAAAATPGAVERTCPHCGFVYFGKPRARCPECAAALDASSANLLQFADARWIRGVALGALILIAAIGVHIIGCILKWTSSPENPEHPEYKGYAHAAGALLLVIGVFFATRREPGAPAAGTSLPARLLSLVAAACWGIFLYSALKGDMSIGAFKSLLSLVLLAQAVLAVLLGFHFQTLAMRVPDDSVATQSFHSAWLSGVVCITMAVIYDLEMNKGVFPMFFMCSFPMIAGFAAIFLWAMVSLLRINLNLRAAAQAGETIAFRKAERVAARNKPK